MIKLIELKPFSGFRFECSVQWICHSYRTLKISCDSHFYCVSFTQQINKCANNKQGGNPFSSNGDFSYHLWFSDYFVEYIKMIDGNVDQLKIVSLIWNCKNISKKLKMNLKLFFAFSIILFVLITLDSASAGEWNYWVNTKVFLLVFFKLILW